jgi:hypothetical protein
MPRYHVFILSDHHWLNSNLIAERSGFLIVMVLSTFSKKNGSMDVDETMVWLYDPMIAMPMRTLRRLPFDADGRFLSQDCLVRVSSEEFLEFPESWPDFWTP